MYDWSIHGYIMRQTLLTLNYLLFNLMLRGSPPSLRSHLRHVVGGDSVIMHEGSHLIMEELGPVCKTLLSEEVD